MAGKRSGAGCQSKGRVGGRSVGLRKPSSRYKRPGMGRPRTIQRDVVQNVQTKVHCRYCCECSEWFKAKTMLEAAEAVEAEQAKVGNPGTSALAVHSEESELPISPLVLMSWWLPLALRETTKLRLNATTVASWDTSAMPWTPTTAAQWRGQKRSKEAPIRRIEEITKCGRGQTGFRTRRWRRGRIGTRVGKLLRGSDVCSIALPAAIMSFWTVLSCCFTTPKPFPRPIKPVMLNKLRVSALLDTGSNLTLVDSKLMKDELVKGSNLARAPILKLCGGDGKELQNDGCYGIKVTINSTSFWHNLIFIKKNTSPMYFGNGFSK